MARRDPLSHLSRHGQLPPALVREVRALGRTAIPRLVAFATDPGAGVLGSAAETAARHALDFLAELGGEASVAAFLGVFATARLGSPVFEHAMRVLAGAGPAAVEPILALAEARGDRWREAVGVLATLGVSDPRIPPLLRELLAVEPDRGADACARYQDPALLPALEAAFDARVTVLRPTGDDATTLTALHQALVELGASDERRGLALVGVLDRRRDQMQAHLDMLYEELNALSAENARRELARLG